MRKSLVLHDQLNCGTWGGGFCGCIRLGGFAGGLGGWSGRFEGGLVDLVGGLDDLVDY